MENNNKDKKTSAQDSLSSKKYFNFFWSLKPWIRWTVLGVLVAVVVSAATIAWFLVADQKSSPATSNQSTNVAVNAPVAAQPQKPKDTFRLIDGVKVPADQVNPPIVAVMFDNHSAARQQSGLTSASLVYETLAEGGITRFIAFYPGTNFDDVEVGPVRSTRDYFVQWVAEFDALYAHAGGSPQGLGLINELDVHDMNALGSNGVYYYRSGKKAAPHNLYTSHNLLSLALRDFNLLSLNPTYSAWKFKDEAILAQRSADEHELTVDWSGSSIYQARYVYRRETNDYARFHGTVAHTDDNNDQQIAPKNVVVIKIPTEGSYGEKGRLDLNLLGEGEALVYRDGQELQATWKKPDERSHTMFYDAAGKDIEFNRGQTWIEVVPGDRTVDYK